MSDRLSISIAIIGAVSVGKSTLLNSLFVEKFSEMTLRRNTLAPQVYMETLDVKLLKPVEEIRRANTEVNTTLQERENPTAAECQEIHHYVKKIHEFNITMNSECMLNIYDLPGLNDAKSSQIYFEYINNNFSKFDIIMFIVDINSGLNTESEMKILEVITDNIKTAVDNKKKVNMITIMNKCDNMELTNGKLKLVDEEHQVMCDQVKKTIETVGNKKGISSYLNNFVILSAENMFLYRMYTDNPKANMDIKHMNKIGYNSVGNLVWNKLKEAEKKQKIEEILKEMDPKDMFTSCGFYELRDLVSSILKKNELDYLGNKIQNMLNQLDEQKINNTCDNEFVTYSNAISMATKINKLYNKSMFDKITKHMEHRMSTFLTVNSTESINNKQQFETVDGIKKQLYRVLSKYREVLGKECVSIETGIRSIYEAQNRYLTAQIQTIYNEPMRLLEVFRDLKNNKYDKLTEFIKETTRHNLGYGRMMTTQKKIPVTSPVTLPKEQSPKKKKKKSPSQNPEKIIDLGNDMSLHTLYYTDTLTKYFATLNKQFEIPMIDIIDLMFNSLMDKLETWNVGEYNLLKFCYRLKNYLARFDIGAIRNEKIIEKYDQLNMYTEVTKSAIERRGFALTRSHLTDPVDMSMMTNLYEMVMTV